MNPVNLSFTEHSTQALGHAIEATGISVLQINLGLLCNLSCTHCHVQAGPTRKEMMSWETMQGLVQLSTNPEIQLIDLTGGAPELHPHIKPFIQAVAPKKTQLRTNLSALLLSETEGMDQFLADHQVGLVASLPCYSESNVDQQRGKGTFEQSITVLQRLNRLGYGIQPDLPLTLVYNPNGPSLPPEQKALESAYKQQLKEQWDIEFTSLSCMTNMPIGKFQKQLKQQQTDQDYLSMLVENFNPDTLSSVMCRSQIHVSWDGTLHDCDFNYALKLPILGDSSQLSQIDLTQLNRRLIRTENHCFGCTAGSGSSCGGALSG